jgi:hypothetical protein
MGDTWITDIRHFIDEKGMIPADIPRPALNLATHLASIIKAVTRSHNRAKSTATPVGCRRRPGRKKCNGFIVASIENDHRIRWFCPVCDDNGHICGWQATQWDCSQRKVT